MNCNIRNNCTAYQDGIADCKNCPKMFKQKPKRYRTIRAWAYRVEGEYSGASKYKSHDSDVPCKIVIEEKYLKEKK